jgi:hypothetical protein
LKVSGNKNTPLSVSALVFSPKPYVASSCTSVGLIQICQGLFAHCHFPNKNKQKCYMHTQLSSFNGT